MDISLKERQQKKSPLPLYLDSHLPACGVDKMVEIASSILNHELKMER